MNVFLCSLFTLGLLLFVLVPPLHAQSGWMELAPGTGFSLHGVFFTDTENGYVVGDEGTGLHTTDGGQVWQSMEMGTAFDLHDVHFVADTGIAVGDGGTIVRTTDAGASWAAVPSGVSDGLRSVSLSAAGGVCGGQSQTILYTTDAGASWEISQSGFFGGGFFGAVMLDAQHAFVGGQNSIFQPLAGRSTNGGATWSFTAFYLNGNEGSLARIDFTDENIGYAAATVWDGTGAISKTTNGGATWSTQMFPSRMYGISFPVSDAGLIGYSVGADGAIRKTVDAGATWTPQDSGTSQTLRDVHFVDFDNGYAVGDGGTILKTTTGGEPPSAIGDDPRGGRLDVARQISVQPTPFRDATEFRFALAAAGPVTLVVYDVEGREVRRLVEGWRAAGAHTVSWDGRSGDGAPLKAGVYAYRMQTRTGAHGGTLVLTR